MRRISANQPYAAPPVGSVPPVLSGVVRRSRLGVVATLAGSSLVLAGCGGGVPAAVPSATSAPPPATSAAPSPLVSDTSSPSPADSPTPLEETPAEEPTDSAPEESDKPPVLDKGATGRALTTADFFATPEDWADGRFDVAGQQDLAGIGGPLYRCRDEPSDSSDPIEIRLANNFTRLSMKVGQSDDSESSSSVVNVKLLGNGKYLDTVQVPFNKISVLEAQVTGVNALKMQIWMGGENCDGEPVRAVLMDLKVE